MEEIGDTKMSLNKLEIYIIVLSEMLKEFVDRTFYKCKIEFKKLNGRMTRMDDRWLLNILDPSNSKQCLC